MKYPTGAGMFAVFSSHPLVRFMNLDTEDAMYSCQTLKVGGPAHQVSLNKTRKAVLFFKPCYDDSLYCYSGLTALAACALWQ